jgi:hypothetical protein
MWLACTIAKIVAMSYAFIERKIMAETSLMTCSLN